MKYIIDSANQNEINQALSMGIKGVTANPSMYAKNNISLKDFLRHNSKNNLEFLSGEAMGETVEEMLEEAEQIHQISPNTVIKINFSKAGLELCTRLSEQGIKTALTLVFTIPQAMAALQAGADYLFPFIGRNDEYGNDGLQFVKDLQKIISEKSYPAKVVAASIKNLHQLEAIATAGVDYAAIPFDLYQKSLYHPLTESGAEKFKEDWSKIK